MTAQIEVELDPVAVGFFVRNLPRETEAALNSAMDDMGTFVEEAQILAYTQNSRPRKPSGSRYIRTFRLRRSSRVRKTGTKLPDLSRKWEAQIRYASYVLGRRAEQARIHANRWKSLEDIAAEALEAWPKIAEERLGEINEKLKKIRR